MSAYFDIYIFISYQHCKPRCLMSFTVKSILISKSMWCISSFTIGTAAVKMGHTFTINSPVAA